MDRFYLTEYLHTGGGRRIEICTPVEPQRPPMGPAREAPAEELPPGYRLMVRHIMLLDGQTTDMFYSVIEGQMIDPKAAEYSGESIKAAFMWALTTPDFADGPPDADDRAREIGNMFSFALAQGIPEDDVVAAYKTAYADTK